MRSVSFVQAFQEGWLQVRLASDERLVSLLKLQLDEGEGESLAHNVV